MRRRRLGAGRCTCGDSRAFGPCARCEASIDAEDALRGDPEQDPDAYDEGVERAEVAYEKSLGGVA